MKDFPPAAGLENQWLLPLLSFHLFFLGDFVVLQLLFALGKCSGGLVPLLYLAANIPARHPWSEARAEWPDPAGRSIFLFFSFFLLNLVVLSCSWSRL